MLLCVALCDHVAVCCGCVLTFKLLTLNWWGDGSCERVWSNCRGKQKSIPFVPVAFSLTPNPTPSSKSLFSLPNFGCGGKMIQSSRAIFDSPHPREKTEEVRKSLCQHQPDSQSLTLFSFVFVRSVLIPRPMYWLVPEGLEKAMPSDNCNRSETCSTQSWVLPTSILVESLTYPPFFPPVFYNELWRNNWTQKLNPELAIVIESNPFWSH